MKKAIVLLSGGIDSTVKLGIAQSLHFEIYALTIYYSQRHKIEVKKAIKIAKSFKVKKHLIININLEKIGGSALTDYSIAVPKRRKNVMEVPITYVPARNAIFLSIAAGWAEVIGANDIFIGVNSIDFSGYPDCREDFIRSFEKAINLGTKKGRGSKPLRINTPLINMKKSQIIKKGLELGIDFSLTHSCYSPFVDGTPCGECDSCVIRKKGFKELGISDPCGESGI